MSPLTRYGFTLVIALYGVYQLRNDSTITGLLALGVAALVFWMGRRR